MKSLSATPRPATAGLRVGPRSLSISTCSGGEASCLAQCRQLAQFVSETDATVVSQRVFSSDSGPCDGLNAHTNGHSPAWPISRLHGNGARSLGCFNCYCQLSTISGSLVKPIEIGGEIVGNVFEDGDFRFCVLGDLRPEDLSASRPAQAESVWKRIEMALDAADMEFADVVRTWFFVDRILEWYTAFNAVRSRFFEDRNLFAGVLPASSGVGTSNSAGAALVADLLAMRPKRGRLGIRNVISPLQCPAMDYRSSFSRAVEVSASGSRLLFVSGTASIAPDGLSAHIGDVGKQVALTMAVVEKILESCRMNWADVTRGIAYFKDVGEAGVLERYCLDNGLPALPVVVCSADICRDDLLFEIEVDAASGRILDEAA
jgi:enamine deaminase RidA (YjgF/YER057c/UK114 family)